MYNRKDAMAISHPLSHLSFGRCLPTTHHNPVAILCV
uniref:Uncharacterized protein n=1 Tax=Anguilla anguilla TaxID=7936 RepID=A0A0E9ULQ6_ANGAN